MDSYEKREKRQAYEMEQFKAKAELAMEKLYETRPYVENPSISRKEDGRLAVQLTPGLTLVGKPGSLSQYQNFNVGSEWRDSFLRSHFNREEWDKGSEETYQLKRKEAMKLQKANPGMTFEVAYDQLKQSGWRSPFDKQCDAFELVHLDQSMPKATAKMNLIGTFLAAYNNHRTLVLSPDQLWYMVGLLFSDYLEKNAEKMRDLFVSHEGKKQLVVMDRLDTTEANWNHFFEDVASVIHENVKTDEQGQSVVHLLQNNFSTTDLTFLRLSNALIMDGMKHYFEFGRCMCLCGLPAVEFMGAVEDYQLIVTKIDALKAYSKDEDFTLKLDKFRQIITKFVETMQGKVDLFWWESMMDVYRQRVGSGGDYNEYVTGWILHLFGKEGMVMTDKIKTKDINVDIKVVKLMPGGGNQEYMVHLVGGFYGMNEDSVTGAITPCVSMAAFKDCNSIKPLSAETWAKFEPAIKRRFEEFGGIQNGHRVVGGGLVE